MQKENNKEKEKKENTEEEEKKTKVTDEADIDIFKRYGKGPYSDKIKTLEEDVKTFTKDINKLCGVRESETGLALPQNWVVEVRLLFLIVLARQAGVRRRIPFRWKTYQNIGQ